MDTQEHAPIAEKNEVSHPEDRSAFTCPDCKGEGLKNQSTLCPVCKGTGKSRHEEGAFPAGTQVLRPDGAYIVTDTGEEIKQ